jgi:hypothetical protein
MVKFQVGVSGLLIFIFIFYMNMLQMRATFLILTIPEYIMTVSCRVQDPREEKKKKKR